MEELEFFLRWEVQHTSGEEVFSKLRNYTNIYGICGIKYVLAKWP